MRNVLSLACIAVTLAGCAPPLTAEQFAALPPAQQKEELDRETARVVAGEALLAAGTAFSAAGQSYAQAPPISRPVTCTSMPIGYSVNTTCY